MAPPSTEDSHAPSSQPPSAPAPLRTLAPPWRQGTSLVLDALLDALLPRRCVGCDAALPAGQAPEAAARVFCVACRSLLLAAPAPKPAPAPETSGQDDAAGPPPCAWLAYDGPVASAISRAKFQRDAAVAAALAAALAAAVRTGELPLPPGSAAVTAVPAHWRRRLWRGFDLPALCARAIADATGLPQRHWLRARRHDAPLALASLGADARAARVAGRFSACAARSGDGSGEGLVLIDDVFTTGATAREATAALQAARHRVVGVLCLARTP